MGHGGIIVTDHDTTRGWRRTREACEKYGLLTMVGCEFTTVDKMNDGTARGAHLLGFDFDPEYPEMKDLLAFTSSVQTERTKLMFKWGQERGTLRMGLT